MVASTFSTLQDNSAHGEDNLLTRDLGNGDFLDVVMDGVTGHGGAEASRELAEALEQSPTESIDDIASTITDVNGEFFGVGGGRFLLTTVSAALYRGGRLFVVAAGDSPIVLVTKDSHERLSGRTGGFLHVGVARAVGAAEELGQMPRARPGGQPWRPSGIGHRRGHGQHGRRRVGGNSAQFRKSGRGHWPHRGNHRRKARGRARARKAGSSLPL